MDTLQKDLAYAFRSLARAPWMTLAAIVCLALGIGATTTVFSATRALVMNPVPTGRSERVVRVSELPPNAPADVDGVSPATYAEWERTAQSFDRMSAWRWWNANLTGIAEAERVIGFEVTGQFFNLLDGRARIGRPLSSADAEPGAEAVVVLSEPLWKRRFASDPDVLGTTVRLNDEPHTVVGVMRDDFIFPPGAELWAPLRFTAADALDRGSNRLHVFARLASGVSATRAAAELAASERRIAAEYPDVRADWSALAEPVQQYYGRHPRPYILMMLGSVSFVLLIACANVANLLLAQGTSREREVAVRMALGAGRGRIVRQLFTESLLLAAAAGAAGVLFALWGVLLFREAIPPELIRFNPGWTRIVVDVPALAFAGVVALACGVIFGTAPAMQGSRSDLQSVLRDGARGATGSSERHRVRRILVVSEIALAFVLLVGTALMLRSFVALMGTDPGFRTRQVLSMQLTLPGSRYDSPAARNDLFDRLRERLEALPEVASVGYTTVLPMDFEDELTRVASESLADAREGDLPIVRIYGASEEYFEATRIPLLSGRAFERRDDPDGTAVAIVSELFARRFWPDADPIGKRIRTIGDNVWIEVVGVVGDIRHNPNNGGPLVQPTVYRPIRQKPPASVQVVLHTRSTPLDAAAGTRRALAALDPSLAPGEVRTLERVLHNAMSPQRTTAGMLAIFGVIALLLASVGVYGVIAFDVRQRADEIGVRMAVGAQRGDVARLVVRGGAPLIALGLAIGLAGSVALSSAVSSLLHDVSPLDPVAYALGIVVLASVGLLACWLPAIRATRIDPVTLLRYE